MKYFSLNLPKDVWIKDDSGEKSTLKGGLILLVGVADHVEVEKDKRLFEGFDHVARSLPYFARHFGAYVASGPSYKDQTHVATKIYTGAETIGATELAKVIDKASGELGSIKLDSVVAWFPHHDNQKDGTVPVIRLRIEASEENRKRVLNIAKEKAVTITDPYGLADLITQLF